MGEPSGGEQLNWNSNTPISVPTPPRERQGHVRIHNNHSHLATFCRIQPLVANSYLV